MTWQEKAESRKRAREWFLWLRPYLDPMPLFVTYALILALKGWYKLIMGVVSLLLAYANWAQKGQDRG
jgi:hypothetical protein